jgi:hypothetical protein
MIRWYYTSREIADFQRLEYSVPLLEAMANYQYDELFHEPGPEEAIHYLWGRLQDRDLSQDEALALLSAVHQRLSMRGGGEPGAYFAYTRFMESLSHEMPVIHDYVVAHWIESRRTGRREAKASAASAA